MSGSLFVPLPRHGLPQEKNPLIYERLTRRLEFQKSFVVCQFCFLTVPQFKTERNLSCKSRGRDVIFVSKPQCEQAKENWVILRIIMRADFN